MRSEFIPNETMEGNLVSAGDVAEMCPWAAKIVEVEGGYHAFESIADYETWAAQE